MVKALKSYNNDQLIKFIQERGDILGIISNADISSSQIVDEDLSEIWADAEFAFAAFEEEEDSIREYLKAYAEDKDA